MMLLSYPESPKSSYVFYSGQRSIQTALLLIAVICIPWMLLGKPIYIIMQNKKRAKVRFAKNLLFVIEMICEESADDHRRSE